MKTKLYMIALALALTGFSCKQKTVFKDYKYADKPITLPCEDINSKLYNEALYSFEDDISNFYDKDKKSNLLMVYSQFLRAALYNRAKYEAIVSPHTLKIFEALKKDPDLWGLNNTKTHLNYNSKLLECISKNIQDQDLKTTLKALLETHSMSTKLFGTPLLTNYRSVLNDKALASYIAFDLYYAKLFDTDLTLVGKETPKEDRIPAE